MSSIHRLSLLILIVLFSATAGFHAAAQDYGSFKGEFIVKWLSDGRNMQLLSEVVYTSPDGKTWTAPKGTITDGASIPKALWSIIGAPFSGKYRNAAVIHDYYCEIQTRSWRNAHLAFYVASRAAGVSSIKAKVMYYAVYRFGPRWDNARAAGDDSSIIVFKPKIIRSEFKTMKAKIERGEADIADIEKTSDRSLRSLSRSIIE